VKKQFCTIPNTEETLKKVAAIDNSLLVSNIFKKFLEDYENTEITKEEFKFCLKNIIEKDGKIQGIVKTLLINDLRMFIDKFN